MLFDIALFRRSGAGSRDKREDWPVTRIATKAGLAAATAMALALGACDDRPAQIDAPRPAPLAELAAPAELAYAPPARIEPYEPARGYQWAERAYGQQRAVYDAPPDYGFGYDDRETMAWETDDDWAMYAEPQDDGYRYYHYEPGAAQPYFVRDREYGYGYDDAGALVAVFDTAGRYLPRDAFDRLAPTAGRYYARGRDLRRAGTQASRTQVSEQLWTQRAPSLERSADPWLRAAREDNGWRAWREKDQDRELKRFEKEQRKREKHALAWRERRDARQAAAMSQPLAPAGDERDGRGDGRRLPQAEQQGKPHGEKPHTDHGKDKSGEERDKDKPEKEHGKDKKD